MMHTVIVGTGIAGVQTALELRKRGYAGEVTLIGDEQDEPYDRPPLSKDFLKGSVDQQKISLLTTRAAEHHQISLCRGQRVDKIDTFAKEVVLADGAAVSYDDLVLATGAENRPLPVPGADLPGVRYLRRLADARGLRTALSEATRVVVVGGGFIGLEVASTASAAGAQVTVVEFLPRVLARVASPEMSEHVAAIHASHGVDILTGAAVVEVIAGPDGMASAVRLSDGDTLPADLVVVGVGVSPSTALAEQAGLRIADGVVVDERLCTSDPHIYAIGDCSRFYCAISGRELRLESIQNAVDQARFVAGQIAAHATDDAITTTSDHARYTALPWFWSEQYDVKLQIAGAAPIDADSVLRGDPASGQFSICRFVGNRLVAVESVNHAKDHLGARKLLAAHPSKCQRVTRDAVVDTSVRLKELLDA